MGRDGFCSIWSLSSKNDDSKCTLPRGRNALRLAWLDNETLQHKTGDDQVVSYQIEDGTPDPIFDSSSSESWQIAAADMTVRFTEGDKGVSIETKNLINGVSKRLENLPLTQGDRKWAISPDRKRLATATKTTNLVDWKNQVGFEVINLETGKVTPIELNGVMSCKHCAWSPDGTRIAFVGNGTGRRAIPTVIAVDTTSGMDVREEQVGNYTSADKLAAVAWSPDGSKLVVGTGVGRCDVIDSESLLTITVARPFGGVVRTVAWHPFDDRIASATNAGGITIWDSISGKNLLTFQEDSWVRQLTGL